MRAQLNGRSPIILPYKEDGLNQVSDIRGHEMYLKMINYKSIGSILLLGGDIQLYLIKIERP